MLRKGWRRRGRRAAANFSISTIALLQSFACGGLDSTTDTTASTDLPRTAASTKGDSSSSYIDSPYQTGVSHGSATTAAPIPTTVHFVPATISFIVDREWATTGVTATLKIVNGMSVPVTLDSFEIQDVAAGQGDAARFFSFGSPPARVTLAPHESYLLDVVFKGNQLISVIARLVVRVPEAPNGEIDAALRGKIISL